MKNTVINFLEQVKQSRSRRRKTAAVLVCLSLIVAGGTTWALHMTGESQTGETYCGYDEEHQHDDSCVEKVLICGYDTEGTTAVETEAPIHTHDESCYEEQTVLTCELEESAGHTHSEECYDADGNLICGMEESEGHTHSEENGCYTTEQALVCGLEEGTPETTEATTETTLENPTHVHTDECYEITYICNYDYEHVHTLSCYSNPEADLETAEDWEKTFADVELTGDFATDLVAIAKTQLGYAESADNYQVVLDDEGNETTETKGYTRYGAWYGMPYEDWCAMFVSFCLNYAEVPTAAFPRDASCPNWIETLSDPEKGYELYRDAADYAPYPGDLVFFDTDDDGEADHVGIVSELTPEYTGSEEYYEDDADYTLTGFKAIEGNSSNQVKENEYDLTDETILGYGALSTVVNDGTLAAYEEGENTAATEAKVEYTHAYTETNEDGTTGNTASWTDTVTATLDPETLGETSTEGMKLNIDVYNSWYTAVGSDMDNPNTTAISVSKAIATYLNSLSGLGEANTQDNNGWNDIQYYDIYWTKSDGTREELPSGTSVTLTWGNKGGLYGNTAAGRIARVIAVSEDDLTNPTFSDGDQRAITALTKDDTAADGITGFSSITFTTGDAPAAYAIVSDIVYTGYVSSVGVNYIKDGSAAFTSVDGDGKDIGDSNGIVRTFDSIEYKYTVTMASISDTFQPTDVKIWLSAEMPYCPTEAQFNTDLMTWANETGDWYIEYWGKDADGNQKVLYYGASGLEKGYLYVVTDWNDNGTAKITRDENGKVIGLDTTDLNTLAKGSDQGENSYMIDAITSQRIVASYIKHSTTSQPVVIPGSQDLIVGISVLNMKKDATVEPTITAWLDGNEENLGYGSSSDDKNTTPTSKQTNAITYNGTFGTDPNYAVIVTCAPMYNVEIKWQNRATHVGWFDFSTGTSVTSSSSYTLTDGTTVTNVYSLLEALGRLKQNQGECDPTKYTNNESELIAGEKVVSLPDGVSLSDYNDIFANIRYGRAYGYGIVIQLANTDSGGNYGMKGLSLPEGPISVDLNLYNEITRNNSDDPNENYYTVLWDYDENVYKLTAGSNGTAANGLEPSGSLGELERTLKWDGNIYNETAYGVAATNDNPYDYVEKLDNPSTNLLTQLAYWDINSCYDGGDWTLTGISDGTETTSTATADGQTYTFQISGYDFDLNDYTFPTHTWAVPGYSSPRYVNYEYCFSAGFVQTLSVMPRVSTGEVDTNAIMTVGNLSVTSTSGDSVSSDTAGQAGVENIKYDYEINTANTVTNNDNRLTRGITLLSAGEWTRREYAVQRTDWNMNNEIQNLTNNYQWGDASVYLGDKFNLGSSIWLEQSSEYTVTACNYLQVFDSYALQIDLGEGDDVTTASEPGAAKTFWPSTKNTGQIAAYVSSSGKYDTNNTAILFAADPDFPEGYNTNETNENGNTVTHNTDKGELTTMQYMNLVREDDLVYADEIVYRWVEWNEDGTVRGVYDEQNDEGTREQRAYIKFGEDKYLACIGVMVEFRGVEGFAPGDWFFNVQIPVKVTDWAEGIVGKTVAAVNTETVWATPTNDEKDYVYAMYKMNENGDYMTDDDGNKTSISWINGSWDSEKGKNTLTDYQTIEGSMTGGSGNGWILGNNNKESYIKLVYENGEQKTGTTSNSTGVSCLIKGYSTSVTIDSEKDNDSQTYNLGNESGTVTYTIVPTTTQTQTSAGSYTATGTDLTLTVTLTGDYSGSSLKGDDLDVDFLTNMYTILINGEEVTISSSASNPTTFTWTGADQKTYTASVYYEQGMDGKTVTFHLSNVTMNSTLPTITAYAQLGKSLPSGSNITATASIWGTGDTIGGKETDIVGIVNLGGTVLSKTVDKELMELDGTVTYTITYTNESENELELAYFYDFIPYNGDIRGTDYYDPSEHEETDTQHNGTFLFDISADSVKASGEDTGDFNAKITFYYSTVDQEELRTTYGVEGFNGYDSSAVETMLNSNDTEGNSLFTVLGELEGTGNGGETKFTLTSEILEKYDKNNDGNVDEKDDEDGQNGLANFRSEVLANITCVYAKVEGMGANRSLNLYLSVRTEENEGADVYGNLAWAWVADSGTTGLRSGIVQTHVVSRSISGVVWYDADLDGVKDDGEKTLDGVTCTLFKKNENGSYEQCTTDVTGAAIYDVVTREEGTYSFTKLAAGEYVVAFKLDGKYASSINGATTYQVNGKNDSTTNDGVALKSTASNMDTESVSFSGISGYDYAIAYSLSGTTVGDMDLHSLKDYQENASSLTYYSNYQENYVNQDLGLVYSIDYTLPKTGGTGTLLYIFCGIVLMAAPATYLIVTKRRRERRAMK